MVDFTPAERQPRETQPTKVYTLRVESDNVAETLVMLGDDLPVTVTFDLGYPGNDGLTCIVITTEHRDVAELVAHLFDVPYTA